MLHIFLQCVGLKKESGDFECSWGLRPIKKNAKWIRRHRKWAKKNKVTDSVCVSKSSIFVLMPVEGGCEKGQQGETL